MFFGGMGLQSRITRFDIKLASEQGRKLPQERDFKKQESIQFSSSSSFIVSSSLYSTHT